MQRTHIRKRLTALLLTLVMLLGIIPTAWAQNMAPNIASLDLMSSPHDRPAESFELTFELCGEPSDGHSFTAAGIIFDYTFVDPSNDAVLKQDQVAAKSLTVKFDGNYVITADFDATAYPCSRMTIGKVIIDDGSGTIHEEDVRWEITITEAISSDMSVGNMSTDKNTVTLTDANYDNVNDVWIDEYVKLTMQLHMPAGYTIPVDNNGNPEYEVRFFIKNDQDPPTNHEINAQLMTDPNTGAIYAECDMGVNFGWNEGIYHIEWVKYWENGKDAVYLPLTGSNIALQVIHAQTDKTAPVIGQPYYVLNGVVQTAGGFRVKPTDTLTFHVPVTDNSKIQDNTTGLRSWGAPDCDLNAQYDATAGELIVTIPVDQMANTEWYMNYFHAVDVYENISTRSLGENFAEMKDLYFYLEDANGVCNVTTKEISVIIHNGIDDTTHEKVTVSRVFDLSDTLGSMLPGNLVPPANGLTLQGWFTDSYSQQTSATNDTLVMYEMDSFDELRLWPAYDQVAVRVHYRYLTDRQEINSDSILVMLPYGKTMQDVMDAAEAQLSQNLTHDATADFQGWWCENNLTHPADPSTLAFQIEPVYAKLPVHVEYNYMQQNGWSESAVMLVYMPVGSTVAQLQQELMTVLAGLPHHSALTLQSWNIPGQNPSNEFSLQMLAETGGHFWASPVYDKELVTVHYGYIDETGERHFVEMPLLLAPGATVQDAIDAAVDLSALKHYGKINLVQWDIDATLTDPAPSYINIEPVYDKIPVNVNHRYLQADGTYEWIEEEILVAPGTTVAGAINAAGLNNVTHYPGTVLLDWAVDGGLPLNEELGWGFGGFTVDAVYTKIPVSVAYCYWNAQGEATVEYTTLLVDNGAVAQDVFDAFDAHTAGVKHWSDAGFNQWMEATGADPSQSVWPGEEYVFYASYQEDLPAAYGEDTAVILAYYDKNMEYQELTIPFDSTKNMTYRQMLELGIAKLTNKHNSNLSVKDWTLFSYEGMAFDDSFLDKTAQAENVIFYALPVYDKAVVDVYYSYRNTKNELVEDIVTVVVDADATYQDVLNKVQLPTDHSTACGFVEWDFWGRDLTDKVADSIMPTLDAVAIYQKYPLTYTYTYMGTNADGDGETYHVTKTVMLDAGADVMEYFENLNNVPHRSQLTFKRWVLTVPNYTVQNGLDLWSTEIAVMAEYEEATPVCIEFAQLNEDLDLDISTHIIYTDGTTDNCSEDELLEQAMGTLEDAMGEILTLPNGFTPVDFSRYFNGYIPMGPDYFSGMYINLELIYDQAVLKIVNPDESETKVVVPNGSKYTLPATYNGTPVVWGGVMVEADNSVAVWGPMLTLFSYYTDCYHSTMTKTEAKAATCTFDGNIEYYTCDSCKCLFADELGVKELSAADVVVKAGHKLTKVAAKAATYTEEGNTEYYTCSGCGKLFADANAEKEITIADTVIAKLPAIVIEKEENKDEATEETKTEVKVELKEEAVEEIIEKAVEEAKENKDAPVVVIDVKKEVVEAVQKEDATIKEEDIKVAEVSIPTATVEKVAELDKKATLAVNLTTATVIMDNKALESVAEQANGESVSLVVKDMEVANLGTAQQAAVSGKKIALTISAELICDKTGEKLATKDEKGFGGGEVTMAVPVPEELPENVKASDLKVYFISDDGKVEHVASKLDENGNIIFTLKHFSEYVITADKLETTAAPNTGDSFPALLMTAALLVSAAGIVVLSRKNKRA